MILCAMIRTLIERLRGPWIADDPNPEPSWLDAFQRGEAE